MPFHTPIKSYRADPLLSAPASRILTLAPRVIPKPFKISLRACVRAHARPPRLVARTNGSLQAVRLDRDSTRARTRRAAPQPCTAARFPRGGENGATRAPSHTKCPQNALMSFIQSTMLRACDKHRPCFGCAAPPYRGCSNFVWFVSFCLWLLLRSMVHAPPAPPAAAHYFHRALPPPCSSLGACLAPQVMMMMMMI